MFARLLGMSLGLVTIIAVSACVPPGEDSSITGPSSVPTPSNPRPDAVPPVPWRYIAVRADIIRVGSRLPTGRWGVGTSTNLNQAITNADTNCGVSFCDDIAQCSHNPPSESANRSWALALGPYNADLQSFPRAFACRSPSESVAASLALSGCHSSDNCRVVYTGTTN